MTAGSLRSAVRVGLVGRERELAELGAGLDDAARGHGGVWLVDGEAGIGKTRLLEALAEAAAPTEVRVVWGRCWEGGGAPAYWPWTQVLGAAMADADADALATALGPGAGDVAALVPEVAARLPGVVPAEISDAPGGRFRLFESVTSFLVRSAAEAPLVVALDDLHAADEASLRLLAFVAAEAPRAHLAVVGTYRDAEVAASPPLAELLSGVARHGHRLSLGGLDRAGVETLFGAATDAATSPEVVARVQELSEGNPFLVKELARLLGRRRLRAGDRLPLPEQAHAIVARRLAPVPEDLRRVLGAAAVLGRDFEVSSLAALSAEAPERLLDALGEARRQGVVEETGAGRWSFAHALLREVLVDELAPSARAQLHRRAAEVLEAGPASDAAPRVAAVAHHRYEAARTGADTSAADACAAAGAQAMAILAFEDAAGWYERALEVLPLPADGGDRCRYDLFVALGRARFRASQFDQARAAYGQALHLARSLGSAELLAEAALGFFSRDHTGESLAPLEEALAALPDVDGALRAQLLLTLGGGLLVARPEEWRTAAALCDAGVAMARRAADGETLLFLLYWWHRFHWDWDPLGVEKRLAVADEGLHLSERAGRVGEWARAGVRLWRFCDLLEMGKVAEARAEADEASREARHLRLPFFTALAASMQPGLALLEGDLHAAEDLNRAARAADGEMSPEEAAYRFDWLSATIHRQRGEFDEARRALKETYGVYSARFPPFWSSGFRADAVLTAAQLGERSACQDLEAAATAALSLPGPPLRPDVLVRLAEACWIVGANEYAEPLYERLRPYASRLVTLELLGAPFGAADRYLGQLAALRRRYDDAEAHFQAAHRLHRSWAAPGLLAHGLADHARMLLLRGGPGDRARAGELATEAAAGYEALDMSHYEERALGLAAEAGSRGAGDAPTPIPERHVLCREGEYWLVTYGGQELRLRDSKGMQYLARLLRAPARELHVLDLTATGSGSERAAVRGHAGALLDPVAKAAYRKRLDDLESEIDEAETAHDLVRAERLRAEREFLVAELAAAVGLGGRDRVAASAAERARQSVTKSVRSAIGRLGEANPALGRHLEATVRTGTFCVYQPDPRVPISWDDG